MSFIQGKSEIGPVASVPNRVDLRRLAEAIRGVEQGFKPGEGGPPRRFVATRWPEIDAVLGGGGLDSAAVHEWFGIEPQGAVGFSSQGKERRPVVPLAILSHLGVQALEQSREPTWLVWVGSRCRPYLSVLPQFVQRKTLIERSIFVNPPDLHGRLWAMEVALRSPATAAVIGDGRGLSMTATRRLRLAAQAGQNLALVVRPPHEISGLSAATTRWCVRWEPTTGQSPRWQIALLRHKVARAVCDPQEGSLEEGAVSTGRWGRGGSQKWTVQWDHEKGVVAVAADVAGGLGQAAVPTGFDFRWPVAARRTA